MTWLPAPRPLRILVLAALAWLALHELHTFIAPDAGLDTIFHRYAHLPVLYLAALVAAAAVSRHDARERLAWSLVAAGLSGWTAGETYYAVVLWGDASPPIPSPADVGYLLFPACMLAGLFSLLRRRVHDVPGTLIADGVTVALAVSAVSAAIVVGTMLDEVHGRPLAVALALAYPIGDMLLIALIAGGLAGMGWRADRRWLMLAAGVSIFWLADSMYAVTAVHGTYEAGGWFDAGWWAGLLAISLAAWAPATPRSRHDSEAMRLIAVPLGFGALGLAVLVYGSLRDVNVLAIALAAASLVAVMARLMLTFRENVAMLRQSRQEATTDPLTGLGNRRALTRALDQQIGRAREADPLVLVLFDLDGFKRYNDRFGHPAGDALLVRLGANLRKYVVGSGRAYRMGGDEFCVLLRPGSGPLEPLVAGAAAALSEHGEGFRIGCSHGVILLPQEARDASEALRIADQRMYASKHAGRRSAEAQSADVLLRALTERHPDLGGHADGVATLAEGTAERLGLQGDELDRVRQAARLHDIGKVAIPDAILSKPGVLDVAEWAFMRRHTLIGARIVGEAPALEAVAELVRASHERWDGTGYPDRLRGGEIPLGARIVAVADAFDAMTAARPYRPARPDSEALEELVRCAGSQFDPVVVQAFCAAYAQARTLVATP